MNLKWIRNKDVLIAEDGTKFDITCDVRNDLNWRRSLHDPKDVVYTMPEPGKPYMPRMFPLGVWRIEKPRLRSDPYKAPVYIPTDAHQKVNIWSLDDRGGYDKKLSEQVTDSAYGLHYSASSKTTLGCGRIASKEEVLRLAAMINLALARGERVTLEVVEE